MSRSKSKKNINFIFEFFPELMHISPEEVEGLVSSIITIMRKEPRIRAISLISIDGLQPITISLTQEDFQKMIEVGSVIKLLNPSDYFRKLSTEIEYRGLGHLNFDGFDIYFTKISNSFALALNLTQIKVDVFIAAEKLIKIIRDALSLFILEDQKKFSFDDIKKIMKTKVNHVEE